MEKSEEIVRLLIKLLKNGAAINAIDIIYLNIIISFLVKKISKTLRKFNEKNKTPLHYAVEKNSKEIVVLLMSKRPDINVINFMRLKILLFLFVKMIYNK